MSYQAAHYIILCAHGRTVGEAAQFKTLKFTCSFKTAASHAPFDTWHNLPTLDRSLRCINRRPLAFVNVSRIIRDQTPPSLSHRARAREAPGITTADTPALPLRIPRNKRCRTAKRRNHYAACRTLTRTTPLARCTSTVPLLPV